MSNDIFDEDDIYYHTDKATSEILDRISVLLNIKNNNFYTL